MATLVFPAIAETPVRAFDVHRLTGCLCDLDANEFAKALSEDVQVCIGQRQVSVGKRAVRMELIGAFARVDSVHLQICAVWTSHSIAVIDLNVTCERSDAIEFMFPLTAILKLRNQLISDIRLFTYEAGMIGRLLARAA